MPPALRHDHTAIFHYYASAMLLTLLIAAAMLPRRYATFSPTLLSIAVAAFRFSLPLCHFHAIRSIDACRYARDAAYAAAG